MHRRPTVPRDSQTIFNITPCPSPSPRKFHSICPIWKTKSVLFSYCKHQPYDLFMLLLFQYHTVVDGTTFCFRLCRTAHCRRCHCLGHTRCHWINVCLTRETFRYPPFDVAIRNLTELECSDQEHAVPPTLSSVIFSFGESKAKRERESESADGWLGDEHMQHDCETHGLLQEICKFNENVWRVRR